MNKKIPNYYKIHPDLFSRYFLIKEILKKNFAKKKITILEVGGRYSPLWEMISTEKLTYELTIIDLLPPEGSNLAFRYIQGDVSETHLNDESFDVVISTDVLEHIIEEKREQFINQCLRLAKDLVIIAAPFNSKDTILAESLANSFYKEITGSNHLWLNEHFKNQRPRKNQIINILNQQKLPFTFFESNNLENWLLIILLNFLSEKVSLSSENLQEVNSFFNMNLFKMDDFKSPAYRQFYIIYKNKNLKTNKNLFVNKTNLREYLKYRVIAFQLLSKEILRREHTNIELGEKINLQQKEINILKNELQLIKNSKFFKYWKRYQDLKSQLTRK